MLFKKIRNLKFNCEPRYFCQKSNASAESLARCKHALLPLQVIQSSPNRDQLKAHLKPPPSLLAKGDGAFTTNKSGGRTITTVKTQKPPQPMQHSKQAQSKTQAVMLRHVFATARQATSAEVCRVT